MDYFMAREEMVKNQLMARSITDELVLASFRKVEREKFVPDEHKNDAYRDYPLPIGYSQTVSQPYMVAIMTELLSLHINASVLEIGTGSGYQAAILANICQNVFTVERMEELYARARTIFKESGYNNIFLKKGDGTLGWEDKGPFDGIIVTAASPKIPESLKKQLKNGGRLVIPVGSMSSQILKLVERNNNIFTEKDICGCVFVPLIGEEGWNLSIPY